jgi:predicted Rossmann fold flavoprotein
MENKMEDVIVIGGGPAGMMAAIMAARNNKRVVLIEKNEKLGKKLFITGKGRCNITNNSDVLEHMKNNNANPKFLYSAYYTLDSSLLINFLEELGLNVKTERGNRVFPQSDKSSDVINALKNELIRQNVSVYLNEKVEKIVINDYTIKEVFTNKKRMFQGANIIIATGGISYAMTGSTGDGYTFAKAMGHKVTPLSQGLVPLEIKEPYVKSLQGLALKNIQVKFEKNQKVLYDGFGEMLFTHYGISGPIILTGSSALPKDTVKDIKVLIDLKPSLTHDQLDQRLLRDFEKNNRKNYSNALDGLLPKKLIPIIIELSKISEFKKVDQITKEERNNLVNLLKQLELTISNRRDYNEAIITRGGVNVKEIDPNTMESKLNKGVYFVGEVLDLDANTGGFNLQIAFSTGYLAGLSI